MGRLGKRLCTALLAGSAAWLAPAAAQTPASPPPAQAPLLPPLSPAVVDNTLAIGGADIAARRVDSRMTVAVEVEGHGPYRFVVDSGADTSALGSRVAGALRLPVAPPAMLHGMTSSGRVDRVTAAELKVGDTTIRSLDLPVLRDDALGAEGLLGIDALVEQRLMMDFDKRVITIEEAHRPAPRFEGEVVVVARRRRGQLILTQASANGRSVDAVIDTGSEVTIGNLALRDRLFRKRRDGLITGQAIGVTGVAVTLQLARLDELKIGPIVMRDVYIAFADVPPFAAFGLRDEPALFLGTDLMASFRRISLDFRSRKIRFQLKRCKSAGVYLATSRTWSQVLAFGDATPGVC